MNTRKSSVIAGHFSWEEWDDQIIAVLHRSDQRFVVKRYAERILANSPQWRQLAQISFSLVEPIARAYNIAENEVTLMHHIFDWHLNGTLKFMIVGGLDQLLDWEDVLDFAKRAEQARKNGRQSGTSTIRSPSIVPTIPVGIPSSTSSSTTKQSKNMMRHKSTANSELSPVKTNKKGLAALRQQSSCVENTISSSSLSSSGNWVQINNVCVPYIIKSQQSRLIPYQVLLECNLLNGDEQSLLHHYTFEASLHDVQTFHTIISSSSSIESTLSADLLLIDLHHLMFGMSNVVYVKLVDSQRDVNKSYKTVLAQRGGTVLIRSHCIPFITRGKFDYILFDSLLAIFRPTTKFMPMLRSRTLPGQSHEIDYLRLVQFYQSNHRHQHDDAIINQHRPLLVSIAAIREHLNENDLLVDMLLTQYQRLENQTMKNEIVKMKTKPTRKATKRKAGVAMLEVQNTTMER